MFAGLRRTPLQPNFPSIHPRRAARLKPHARFQHTEESALPKYATRRQSVVNPTLVILGIIPIAAFALGTWQVDRLKWKINLIDELREKLDREPISLPSKVNLSALPDFIYRKVILRGHWDHTHSVLLGPRVRDGTPGYHLVTPLVRENGTTILVDRGFVPKDRPLSGPREEGEVEVCGMLRDSQRRNSFTPDNHPEKGEWYWADVNAMADHAGGGAANVQPVLVEEMFEGHAGDATSRLSRGIPVGRSPEIDIRNAHASYVVTWYSLSAFTAVMFVRLLLKRRREVSRLPR